MRADKRAGLTDEDVAPVGSRISFIQVANSLNPGPELLRRNPRGRSDSDIKNGLCKKTRYSGASDVLNPTRESRESFGEARVLLQERTFPRGCVRDQLHNPVSKSQQFLRRPMVCGFAAQRSRRPIEASSATRYHAAQE